jgi:hypothetical protein
VRTRGRDVGHAERERRSTLRGDRRFLADAEVDAGDRRAQLAPSPVDQGVDRFEAQLRDRLPAISPRALTLALKALSDAGLVERRVVDGFPPSTLYRLSRRARPIRPPLRRLAVA